MRRPILLAAALQCLFVSGARAQTEPDKLLWGDVHVHTNLSIDAYFFKNRSGDADAAYRFAKGEPVANPYDGALRRLHTPLDFMAVTDHAEFLGVPYQFLNRNNQRLVNTRLGQRLEQLVDAGRSKEAFGLLLLAIDNPGIESSVKPASNPRVADIFGQAFKYHLDANDGAAITRDPTLGRDVAQPGVLRTSWESNLAAADRHNDPGRFTTFVGWEYSSAPDGANLHRVVLSTADGVTAERFLPYSSNRSSNPEDLWTWLGRIRAATGADFVTIPHNSNLSKGRMFAPLNYDGGAMTAQSAGIRASWESLAEVTQIKGTSETHPAMSPEDEFAGFELFSRLPDPPAPPSPPTRADTVRGALLTGIETEARLGVNPFKLGMIGSTDSHSGLPSAEEDNFNGHFALDSVPENKSIEAGGNTGWDVSASGLAAVWARANSRPEIIAAMKRREVYATSGPRIRLRFFGGYDFAPGDESAPNVAAVGYAKGVPMGADLTRSIDARAPTFLVQAVKDPLGANLDRVQIVIGWLGSDGVALEKVFDIAWSGGRSPDANGRLPPVGDSVDRRTAAYSNSIGEPMISAVWSDPEFVPAARAFYYVRVLQIPTPRNSLYASVALSAPPPAGYPEAIQERAFSSPIWYAP